MVKKIIVKPVLSDVEISQKEGDFFNIDKLDIINYDCDVYRLLDGVEKLLLSFRKKVIPKKLCDDAFIALESTAKKKHNNRGAAAGKLDLEKLPAFVKKVVSRQKFRGHYIGKSGRVRKDHISNYVSSGIIGYYDKPDRNIFRKTKKKYPVMPCRMTKFTREHPDKWNKSVNLIKKVDKLFKKLVPKSYAKQLARARETPDFIIKDTAFSTATINYDYQTALHKDKGDFDNGFGNLIVLEKSEVLGGHKYIGGYTAFPQYGIAVDIRHRDFLAMDVHQWHCNTSLEGEGRLSVVCYLRSGMLNCKL